MIGGWKFYSSMGPTDSRIGGKKDMDSFLLQCLFLSLSSPLERSLILSWWGMAWRLFPLGKKLKSISPLNPANTALAQKLEWCLVLLGEMKGLLFLPIWHHSGEGAESFRSCEEKEDTWRLVESQFLDSVCRNACKKFLLMLNWSRVGITMSVFYC